MISAQRSVLLVVALLLLLAPAQAHAEKESNQQAPRGGGIAATWFHLGGGFGLTGPGPTYIPRAVFGFGGYAPFFYGSVGAELSNVPTLGAQLSAVGSAGIAIPLPLIHPMIGLRGGVGVIAPGEKRRSAGLAGLHLGFILRRPSGRLGLRIAIDVDLLFVGQGPEFSSDEAPSLYGQLVPTAAFVF